MIGINNSKRLLALFFCIVFIASLVTSLAALNHFQVYAQGASSHAPRPGIHADSVGNWPEIHGDAARDSDQPGETLLSKANINALTPVPGISYSNLGSMESSPAVYQGVVYVTGMTQTISGSTTTNVSTMYAIDAISGAIVWSEVFPPCAALNTSEWVLSPPAATSGMVNGVLTPEVYVGWGSPDGGGKFGCISSTGGGSCTGSIAHGYIWAVDAMSTNPGGTLLWKSQNFGSDIVSSPVIVNQDNNAVIFVLGPWRLHLATRGDLLALDPTNGTLLADYPVFNHAYGTLSSPAVSNGRVYVTEGYTSYKNPHPIAGSFRLPWLLKATGGTACPVFLIPHRFAVG